MSKRLDPDHALLVGNVAGALHRLTEEYPEIPAKIEMLRDEKGYYTNQIRVVRESGSYLITVEKEDKPK